MKCDHPLRAGTAVRVFGLLFPLTLTVGLAQDLESRSLETRVVKRTAMIERGREIIMEQVVFEEVPEEGRSTSPPSPVPVVPRQRPSVRPPLQEQSFVINPATRPDGLSLVTWWPTTEGGGTQRHRCWSNIDWSLFGTGLSFVRAGTRYTLLCLPGTLPQDGADHQVIPPRALQASPKGSPFYQLIAPQRGKRYRPDPAARRFMRDLHHHVADHQAALRLNQEERKREGQALERKREAERRQPKDLVIRFGLKPQPAQREQNAPAKRNR